MNAEIDLSALQGNILRGYRSNLSHVRHLVLEVVDRAKARQFLGASAAGGRADVPQITRETTWTEKQGHVLQHRPDSRGGLRALGTPATSLATFPSEFVEGMTSRALKLGDLGASAPATASPAPLRPTRPRTSSSRRSTSAPTVTRGLRAPLNRVQAQVAKAFNVLGVRNGRAFPGNRVHFDYVDNISQPRFHKKVGDIEPADPLGTVLLGHPTRLEGLMYRVPEPCSSLGSTGPSMRSGYLRRTLSDSRPTSTVRRPNSNSGSQPPEMAGLDNGRGTSHCGVAVAASRQAAGRSSTDPVHGAARDRGGSGCVGAGETARSACALP